MKHGTGRVRRGRPPDPEKRSAVLAAATRLFLERGYAGTSMDSIALAAGVSKLTVYAHFGVKEKLFQEIVRTRCDAYNRPDEFDAFLALDPRNALRAIGGSFLALLMDPETLRLNRMLVGEAARRPKMALLFFEAGPDRMTALVARYLRRATARGHFEIDRPRTAADQFLALVKGKLHYAATLNVAPRPGAAALARQVEASVEVFLRAYAPRGARIRDPARHAGRKRPAPRDVPPTPRGSRRVSSDRAGTSGGTRTRPARAA